ncbi:MAG: hypothetical protein ACOCYT_05370 [Chloroflexota bacterium]
MLDQNAISLTNRSVDFHPELKPALKPALKLAPLDSYGPAALASLLLH